MKWTGLRRLWPAAHISGLSRALAFLLMCGALSLAAALPSRADRFDRLQGVEMGKGKRLQEAAFGEWDIKDDPLDEMMDEESWEGIERFLQNTYGGRLSGQKAPAFSKLVKSLMAGEGKQALQVVLELLGQAFEAELGRSMKAVGQVLALGVLGAVFANFSSIFPSGQIAQSGEFLTLLLLFTVLAAAFLDGAEAAGKVLERQTEFMRVLVPAYGIAVAWAGSGMMSAAWMEFILFLIMAVEWLYLNLLLPLSKVCLLLILVGNLASDNILSRMTELIQDGIRWGTRSLVGLVLGFHIVQGMVLPFADSVKTAGVQKLVQAIPGIGAGAGAAAKLLLGSGVLIKNAMGAAAVIVLAIVSLMPMVKLAALMALYRIAAAILQPVASKQVVNAVSGAADGQKMLLGLVVHGMLIFVLAIALVCFSTNAAYLA